MFLRGFFDANHPDRGLGQIDQTQIYPLAADDRPAMQLNDGVGSGCRRTATHQRHRLRRLASIIDYEARRTRTPNTCTSRPQSPSGRTTLAGYSPRRLSHKSFVGGRRPLATDSCCGCCDHLG